MSDEMSVPSGDVSSAPEVSADVGADNSTQSFESQGESSEQIDAIQDAVDSGDLSQKEANNLIRKLQLKVNGKIIEKEVDLSDEDFLRNQFQLAEVSKQSMQKAAEQEKMFRELLGRGGQDIGAFMKEVYGIDPDDWAASHIERKIEHLKKSPEVLEKERIAEELRVAREEAKKLKEEKEAIEMSKLQEQAMASLQEEISNAITAHTKLPNSRMVQKRMAQAMDWAVNNGYPDATAEDVAPLVETEMRQELEELFGQMPEDALEVYFGKKNLERLRKSRIAKAKEVHSVNAVKQTAAVPKSESKPVEKIDSKKFWRGR